MTQSDLLGQLRIDREAAAPPPRGRLAWVLVLALLVVIAVGAYNWRDAGASPEVEVATAVSAASRPSAASVLDASGYVVARRQATVSSKVTGKVVDVMIEEGMQVSQGQVLARLEATQQEADTALRRAQLAAARSQLGEIEAQLRQAEADLRRQQEVTDRRLGSAAALDASRAQAESLQARLQTARSQIVVAERTLQSSQVALDDTVIRAPFDGIVVAKAAQPGEMISPVSAGGGFTRTGIGTLVDMGSLEVEVDVNEAFIGRVSPAMPVTVTLNAYPDWRIPGRVIAVIPAADRTKATVPVRVAMDQKDPRIVPDMGARVAFLENREPATATQPETGLLVPSDAVVERGGQSVVFVLVGERVSRRNVVAGEQRGGNRLISRGLEAGETVVVAPAPDLSDGTAVRRRGPGR